jgi:prevent-host-death family protein
MATAGVTNLKGIPRKILGVTELRRNPQKVFAAAKKEGAPILVTEFSEPRGIILSLDTFDAMVEELSRLEVADAIDSIDVYRREKSFGTLRKLKSLEDLIEDER